MPKRNRRARRPNPVEQQALTQSIQRAQAVVASKQPRFGTKNPQGVFSTMYKWVKNETQIEPAYSTDSRARDRWLSEIWRKEPHIAGVISSVCSINSNRGWWISGGRNQVKRFNHILRNAEGGAGWRQYMSQGSLSYYTGDLGFISEVARDGGPDGPLRDLYFVDNARCYLTGRSDYPLSYTPENGKEQGWIAQDYLRVTAMPSANEAHRGLGFCPLSKSISFVQIMMAIYEHDKETLGAKAPKGLLLLNNISQAQWVEAMQAREANRSAKERDYFGGVAVLAQEGIDQVDAKLVALSQLPAGFNLEMYTNLMMYGIALCFDYDPREFWPVSQGSLGTGFESQIQHTKTKAKGGVSFVLGYQDQIQQELPDTIEFQFEQRDIDGEMIEAQVKKAWADVATSMYDKGTGPLTYDEARIWLAEAGVIPVEWTFAPDEATAEASGEISSQARAKRLLDDAQEQRDQWAKKEQLWAAAFSSPNEAIIRCNQDGKTEYLYQSGFDFLKAHRTHKMARSMAQEFGYTNQDLAREFFGRSFQVIEPLAISRAAAILYDRGEVKITQEDVNQAIKDGGERVGVEFSELLQAD